MSKATHAPCQELAACCLDKFVQQRTYLSPITVCILRRIVKLISPKLNYFVIAGAMMLYALVYVRVLPFQTELAGHITCNVSIT